MRLRSFAVRGGAVAGPTPQVSPLFSGANLPEPPEQKKPWTPSETRLPKPLLTATAAYFFMLHLGKTGPSYAVAFLGIFAVAAMWVFPEVTKKSPVSLK